MERSESCMQVLSQVRYAAAAERAAIQSELAGHLEDHAQALTEEGYTASVCGWSREVAGFR